MSCHDAVNIAFLCETKSSANVNYTSEILYGIFIFKQNLEREEYPTAAKQYKVTQQASKVTRVLVSSPTPELCSDFPKVPHSDTNRSITEEKKLNGHSQSSVLQNGMVAN